MDRAYGGGAEAQAAAEVDVPRAGEGVGKEEAGGGGEETDVEMEEPHQYSIHPASTTPEKTVFSLREYSLEKSYWK